MIKAEAHMETGAVELHVNGSLKEILVEVTMLLNGIYATYAGKDPKAAQAFRRALVRAMVDPENDFWCGVSNGTTIDLAALKRQKKAPDQEQT